MNQNISQMYFFIYTFGGIALIFTFPTSAWASAGEPPERLTPCPENAIYLGGGGNSKFSDLSKIINMLYISYTFYHLILLANLWDI